MRTSPRPAVPAPIKATPAERLLEKATELFAAHGIRAIGIDRILSESGVARGSLYSAYGSKEALVVAYLDALDAGDRARWETAVADLPNPVQRLIAFFDLAIASAPKRNYRGCQYLNATTEFPDSDDPVRAPVRAHRAWVLRQFTNLLTEADIESPVPRAKDLQLVYDGALAGSKMEHSDAPLRRGRLLATALINAAQPSLSGALQRAK